MESVATKRSAATARVRAAEGPRWNTNRPVQPARTRIATIPSRDVTNCSSGRDADDPLWHGTRRRLTEAIERDSEQSNDHRAETIESAARQWRHAEIGVSDRQRQHDDERREHEAEAPGAAIPPTAAGVREEDSELRRRRARHHVRDREAFEETLLRHPLPSLLKLVLHQAHDGGATV